jgi:hypothetical protein
MKKHTATPHSQLFTVRLWAEPRSDGSAEWRGQLRHVATGEVRYFRDWPRLLALLVALAPDAAGALGHAACHPDGIAANCMETTSTK